MISLAWKKRAIPLYWKILTHKGASNLTEQKAVIRPVIRLLKSQKIWITVDREFHSIFLLIYSCIRNRNIVKNLF